MLRALSAEEFGTVEHAGNPVQAAFAAGISTGVGAIIPVIPFIFATGALAILLAAIISLAAHFLVGAAKSLVTLRSWLGSRPRDDARGRDRRRRYVPRRPGLPNLT